VFKKALIILYLILFPIFIAGFRPLAISNSHAFVADTAFDCSTVTEIPQAECQALVALYESTNGDAWDENAGWLVTNTPCTWDGVVCEAGHVTQLNLDWNGMSGTIPSDLQDLANLYYLNLANNQLSGVIPVELGTLSELEGLIISDNELTGTIPAQLGNLSKLKWLILRGNMLEGNIPSELGSISTLEQLRLPNNRLTGSIPPELGALINLKLLYLAGNQLSSLLPSEIGNLASLQSLTLSNNPALSGSLPISLVNLTLSSLWFENTGLCEPANETFQTWLGTIADVRSTDVICAPSLTTNYVSGCPGSYFTLTGADFDPSSLATIAINNITLGTLTTNTTGSFTFTLSTSAADEGYYAISASVNPRASTLLVLDDDAPVRPQEGGGIIYVVPSGIAYTNVTFLPLVTK